MNKGYKAIIEMINCGKIPNGFQKQPGIGIIPYDWSMMKLENILKYERRAARQDSGDAQKIGLRLHLNGIFYERLHNGINQDKMLYLVNENDLILNESFAWAQAIAIAEKDDDSKLVSSRFPTYSFKNRYIPEFYGYVIQTEWFKELLNKASHGGRDRNRILSKKLFEESYCIVPPEKEQKDIAMMLSLCDKIIILKEKLLQKMIERNQWIVNTMFEDSNQLPKIRIKDACSYISNGNWVSSYTPSENGIFMFQTGNIGIGKYLDKEFSGKYLDEEIIDRLYCEEVLPGDVLVSRHVEPAGRACLAPDFGRRMIASRECIIIRFNNQIIQNGYFVAYACTQEYLSKISTKISGQLRILLSDFEQIQIPLMPYNKQLLVSETFQTAMKENGMLQEELYLWRKKKKLLMELLLKGIVRCDFKSMDSYGI